MGTWLEQTGAIVSAIISFLTLVGIIFIIYNKFRDPDIKAEKRIDVLTTQVSGIDKSLENLKDNHLHTISEQIKNNACEIGELKISVTRLATIIEERFPKK